MVSAGSFWCWERLPGRSAPMLEVRVAFFWGEGSSCWSVAWVLVAWSCIVWASFVSKVCQGAVQLWLPRHSAGGAEALGLKWCEAMLRRCRHETGCV